jgi:hypothetical protein
MHPYWGLLSVQVWLSTGCLDLLDISVILVVYSHLMEQR